MRTWTPWIDFDTKNAERLPVDEPPCKDCKHWFPHREYGDKGNFTGVRMCNKDEMHHDFSCFVSK